MRSLPDHGSSAAASPVLSNAEIADRLASLAQLPSAQKENPYKGTAYQQAAARIRTRGGRRLRCPALRAYDEWLANRRAEFVELKSDLLGDCALIPSRRQFGTPVLRVPWA